MAAMGALTPDDLGPRSQLLVEKHAAYIASFSTIWEVGPLLLAAAQNSGKGCRTAQQHAAKCPHHLAVALQRALSSQGSKACHAISYTTMV
jgi:hypothetical protein